MSDDGLWTMQFNDTAIRVMRDALATAIKHWPGGDPSQQQALKELESLFNAVMLEMIYDES